MSIFTTIMVFLLLYAGATTAAYFQWRYETLIKPVVWFFGLFQEKQDPIIEADTKPTTHREHE